MRTLKVSCHLFTLVIPLLVLYYYRGFENSVIFNLYLVGRTDGPYGTNLLNQPHLTFPKTPTINI